MALAKTDARIVVLDKLTYAGNLANLADVAADRRFAFVRADIADREAVAAVFREHRPSAVINFAAESHVDRSIDDPADFVRTNVVGTFELLEAARRQLAGSDRAARERFRFLHVSTDEVYGSLGPTGAFCEATPYEPNSPYSASKAGADHLVRAYHATYGVPALITNCSNNYGPYQFPEKLIPLMILNALEGEAAADLRRRPQRARLALRRGSLRGDPARARARAAGREIQPRRLRRARERRDRRRAVRGARARSIPAAENPALARAGVAAYADLKRFVADRPGHDRRYAIDSARAQKELGWRPAHDLAAGLAATVQWYLDHRDWCEAVQSGRYRRERLGLGDRSRS